MQAFSSTLTTRPICQAFWPSTVLDTWSHGTRRQGFQVSTKVTRFPVSNGRFLLLLLWKIFDVNMGGTKSAFRAEQTSSEIYETDEIWDTFSRGWWWLDAKNGWQRNEIAKLWHDDWLFDSTSCAGHCCNDVGAFRSVELLCLHPRHPPGLFSVRFLRVCEVFVVWVRLFLSEHTYKLVLVETLRCWIACCYMAAFQMDGIHSKWNANPGSQKTKLFSSVVGNAVHWSSQRPFFVCSWTLRVNVVNCKKLSLAISGPSC